MCKSLLEDFGIRRPKIAILGLNPHAGDQGAIGKEELEIIMPAVEALKAQNILAFGPFPADGFFGSEAYKNYDGVLAMYHDQGLAPFKALSFSGGVNFTAGLKFVRTSPDHGTAYDIAGKNLANESSFREAVYMAIDIFRTRNTHVEISANPLKAAPRQREGRER
jgi:4-hydroxythreonine-4-phosphate dehydrogenase